MLQEKNVKFTRLSEQDRIAALVSGINNYFGKALTLYVMRTGRQYTFDELAIEAENFLGENLPFSRRSPYTYCQDSLRPIGAVVESSVRKKGTWVRTYAKTDDGEIYGDPSIARFLFLADRFGISMNRMNGGTNSGGKVRRGYVIAVLLEELADGERHTQKELSEATGIKDVTILGSLNHLSKIGFIDYKSVKVDAYGDAEKGFSVAVIKNKGKLEEYLSNEEKLRKDVRKKRERFSKFGHLTKTLQLRKEELDRQSLSSNLNIFGANASTVISLLCDLGVYGYKEFAGAKIKSSVKILDKGRTALEIAYLPILKATRESDSRYAKQEYRQVLDRLSGKMDELFREERVRYVEEKQMHNQEGVDEKNRIVLHVIRKLGTPFFRVKNVKRSLEEDGTDIKYRTINKVFGRLVKDGILERCPVELKVGGEVRKFEKGYYRVAGN